MVQKKEIQGEATLGLDLRVLAVLLLRPAWGPSPSLVLIRGDGQGRILTQAESQGLSEEADRVRNSKPGLPVPSPSQLRGMTS